ncbi:MAG TPA: DUF3014 domain-containing protein [Steroidobacteraceae bacterium]|nr:DUF3014 domain-containing protein [Steroidobacteraceae bacterium]
MNRSTAWLLGAVVALAAVGYLVYRFLIGPAQAPDAEVVPPPPVVVEPEPVVEHPVPEIPVAEEPEPLPLLDQSDELVAQSLAEVTGEEPVEAFLVPGDVVRKTVATVDSLDAKKLFPRIRAVQPTEGDFVVENDGETIMLGEENFKRYDRIVGTLEATSTERLADLYFRYYPLFQQAYVELGYPSGYFNDRLVEVIDHLLATPDVSEPIRLEQPSVYYTFADPDLEALSSGQKLLLRMGPQHRATVKQKLRDFRAVITERTATP